MSPAIKDAIIVGGGFSGLAAALQLQRAGVQLRLFEKRAFFGGRAYSFHDLKTGDTVDNGQHLMMGAYHETLKFLKNLGTLDQLRIQERLEVTFVSPAKKHWRLRGAKLPAPFHLAWGILHFKGFSWRDKLNLAKLAKLGQVMADGQNLKSLSALEFLRQAKQSERAILNFWEPLILATLNEPPELAAAQLFWEVLRRGLLSNRQDSKLILPQVGFDELYTWPAQDYLEQHQVPIHWQTQIARIERFGDRWKVWDRSGENFEADALILAVPPKALTKILQASSAEFTRWGTGFAKLSSSPIISINLWFEDFSLSHSFMGLLESPIHWIFDKAKILAGTKSSYLTLVLSGAREFTAKSKEELIAMAHAELLKYFPQLQGKKLLHSQIVKEHEATFGNQCQDQALRPPTQTPWEKLYLAGDWTQTDLPATIEGAVLSGHRAAQAYLES